MQKIFQSTTVLLFVAFMMVALASTAAAEIPAQLPDPDGKPTDTTKPVKVFILMGQSNMLGGARVALEDQTGDTGLLRQGNVPAFRTSPSFISHDLDPADQCFPFHG